MFYSHQTVWQHITFPWKNRCWKITKCVIFTHFSCPFQRWYAKFRLRNFLKNDVRRCWLLRRDSLRASGALFFDFGHLLVKVLVWDGLQLWFWVLIALFISPSSSVAGLPYRFYHDRWRRVLFLFQVWWFFPFLARAATVEAIVRFLAFSADPGTFSTD